MHATPQRPLPRDAAGILASSTQMASTSSICCRSLRSIRWYSSTLRLLAPHTKTAPTIAHIASNEKYLSRSVEVTEQLSYVSSGILLSAPSAVKTQCTRRLYPVSRHQSGSSISWSTCISKGSHLVHRETGVQTQLSPDTAHFPDPPAAPATAPRPTSAPCIRPGPVRAQATNAARVAEPRPGLAIVLIPYVPPAVDRAPGAEPSLVQRPRASASLTC
mmetsp:Transcript_16086/g.47596  ORF Transcript_16086/g.47596 Transcript_16086/m.47596 type:complete len:218 (-) Transcript_16086:58-711(-)